MKLILVRKTLVKEKNLNKPFIEHKKSPGTENS